MEPDLQAWTNRQFRDLDGLLKQMDLHLNLARESLDHARGETDLALQFKHLRDAKSQIKEAEKTSKTANALLNLIKIRTGWRENK